MIDKIITLLEAKNVRNEEKELLEGKSTFTFSGLILERVTRTQELKSLKYKGE